MRFLGKTLPPAFRTQGCSSSILCQMKPEANGFPLPAPGNDPHVWLQSRDSFRRFPQIPSSPETRKAPRKSRIGLAGPKMQVLRMQDKISPVVASLFRITFHTVALQTSWVSTSPRFLLPPPILRGTDITAASPHQICVLQQLFIQICASV